MKLKSKILIFIIGIFLIIMVLNIYYPIVINIKAANERHNYPSLKKGDSFKLFDNYDFDSGDWTMYLLISEDDKQDLSQDIKYTKCLKTNKIKILKEIQKNWVLKYTDSDMATTESEIILCRNHTIIFRSGIVLSDNIQGLQNQDFGWIQANNNRQLSKEISQFERINFPILLFW
jgi:hypothetical protein